ncbi:MAG TPA: DUF134 domain-containing protein [Candidatus Absconditabacterales bacterium]|nr:DUF134 domain-containing protein [Candidatus Absconditabacterales bacterium]
MRNIEFFSDVEFFKPAGIPSIQLEEVELLHDEIEALRLKNIEKLDIIDGAKKMGISKSTFARIYNQALDKIADAIINVKSIKIEK